MIQRFSFFFPLLDYVFPSQSVSVPASELSLSLSPSKKSPRVARRIDPTENPLLLRRRKISGEMIDNALRVMRANVSLFPFIYLFFSLPPLAGLASATRSFFPSFTCCRAHQVHISALMSRFFFFFWLNDYMPLRLSCVCRTATFFLQYISLFFFFFYL